MDLKELIDDGDDRFKPHSDVLSDVTYIHRLIKEFYYYMEKVDRKPKIE